MAMMFGIAQRISGRRVLHADDGADITGVHLVDFITLVGVHAKDTTDALLVSFGRVVYVAAALQYSTIYTEISQAADIRVGSYFESQS